MKAALKTADGKFEIQDVDMPKMEGPDWVVVRIRVAGICGTDLRHWKHHDEHLKCKVMGHEMAGEVVEVGPSAEGVKVGDRVVVETVLGDDRCDWCVAQQYNLCPHLYDVRMETVSRAFAEFVAAPAKKVYHLPDHVSFEEAALLDTYSVCLHALHLSGFAIGQKAAVIGAGPIGLGQAQLVKAMGGDVLVTDVVAHALELARRLGADMVVDTTKDDARQAVQAFTHGRGVDIAFECAGGTSMPTTLPQAVSFVRVGGKVVIVGGFDPGPISIPLEWQKIQMAEIKILPSASYAFFDIDPEMKICLELLAAGKLDAKSLITHRFKLDDINEAFETAADKEGSGCIFVALEI